MSILKRKKEKPGYDNNSFYLGTKFKHRNGDLIVYEITKIEGSSVYVSWEGYKKHVSFSLENVRFYFKEGEWIKV